MRPDEIVGVKLLAPNSGNELSVMNCWQEISESHQNVTESNNKE